MKKLTNPAEFAYLRENIDKMSYEEFSAHFGVPTWEIRRACKQQAIRKTRRARGKRKFTPEVDAEIRRLLDNLTISELADQLGASESGISKRIREMGLRKSVPTRIKEEIRAWRSSSPKKPIRPSHAKWLVENSAKHTLAEIAEHLGVSRKLVPRYIEALGIDRPRRVQQRKKTQPVRPSRARPTPARPTPGRMFQYDETKETSREEQLRDFMREMNAKPLPRRQLFQPVTIARI